MQLGLKPNCILFALHKPFLFDYNDFMVSFAPITTNTTGMIYIANPTYDAVFKYAMADTAVARFLIATLLGKDVYSVTEMQHEKSLNKKQGLFIYRQDYLVEMRNCKAPTANNEAKHGEVYKDTSYAYVTLQKTGNDIKSLKAREHLGGIYAERLRVDDSSIRRKDYPIINIYLFCHSIEGIDAPIYHHFPDADNNAYVCPFTQALKHETVIVQIPRISSNWDDNESRLLSILTVGNNQAHCPHVVGIDTERLGNAPELLRFQRRLTEAAANPNIQEDMNVEDQSIPPLEWRDTRIMLLDKEIKKNDLILARLAKHANV